MLTRPSSRSRGEPENSALLFAALGDNTRLRLVLRMSKEGPLSITLLTAGAKVTRQAVTKHLRVMEEAGLVHNSRQGRESVWELDLQRLEQGRRYLDRISAQWNDALDRLRAFVEN